MDRELITSFNGRIQLFRNLSATTITDASLVLAGEIAVGDGVLFIKNANGEIATFSNDEKLLSLNEVIGTSSSGQSRDRFYYEDASGNVSARLNNMALKVGNATPSIDTNFKVEMVEFEDNGTIMTQPMFLYNIDCPVNVVYVKKVSGDTETIIHSSETQASSGAVTVENIEEEYVLEFIPSELPNVIIKETIHVYVCCLTSTSASTLDSNTVAQLNYLLTSDKNVTGEVHTNNGEYIYVLIPSTVGLKSVKSQNIGVKLSDTTSTLVSNIGNFVYYKTLNALGENDWKLKIDLTGIKGGNRAIVSSKKPKYLDYWKITGNSVVQPYADGIVLPQGYKRCEYLTFDGNCYFNTSAKTANDIGFSMDFATTKKQTLVMGARQTANANGSGFVWGYLQTANKIGIAYGNGTNTSIVLSKDYADGEKHHFVMDSTTCRIDNEDINIANVRGTATDFFDITVGTWKTSNYIDYRMYQGNLYDTVIYNSQGDVWHGIPCLDVNDIPCFYDTVTQKAFYNLGSGTLGYKLYPQEIWSCGILSTSDNKYHILCQPSGKTSVDIILDQPLRKFNNVADTLEYSGNTNNKATLTVRVQESDGVLTELGTPTTTLVDVPDIIESTNYTIVINQGDKGVGWTSFETE